AVRHRTRRIGGRKALGNGFVDQVLDRIAIDIISQRNTESLLRVGQTHAILWPFRPSYRWLNSRQIQLQRLGEGGFDGRVMPQSVSLRIALDQGDLIGLATSET